MPDPCESIVSALTADRLRQIIEDIARLRASGARPNTGTVDYGPEERLAGQADTVAVNAVVHRLLVGAGFPVRAAQGDIYVRLAAKVREGIASVEGMRYVDND